MSWKNILKTEEFCDECGDRIESGESHPVESMKNLWRVMNELERYTKKG